MSDAVSTLDLQALLKKVYRAFFSPPKYEVRSADQAILDRGRTYRLPFEGGALAVTTWGEGPSVLLVHGWGGARAQMTGFVEPLLAAGYRVVAYDQPAHGESDGTMTNLLEIAPTMGLIAQHEGPFHAVIAHSFGTLVTSYAIVERGFPRPARLAYFGAFNRLMDSLPRFQAQAGVSDEIMRGLRGMMDEKFGRGVLDTITNEALTPHIAVPALMFHDAGDGVTPLHDSRAIARAWPQARLVETEGLGHRGALQSGSIQELVVDFLNSGE